MREILFVAGEVSGDQHASAVARSLRDGRAPYRLTGIGGDLMNDAGVELIKHSRQLSVMGFVEPLRRLPLFRRLHRDLKRRLASGEVALVVLVDFAGFNMRVAASAARAGVPVLYFITPQVWASRAGRLGALARTVTRAAVILPFEEALLREHGIDATFVGHPLIDRAAAMPDRAEARRALGMGDSDRVLALFPGSRAQEIKRHLAPFVAAARELQRRDTELKVVVSAAPHVSIPPEECPFPLVQSASLALLRSADAAICKSGTTTLEAAVALCPMVIAYRTDPVTYAIGRRIVKIPYIGLVNVLAGREIAPELVQSSLTPAALVNALTPLLDMHSERRKEMIGELQRVRTMLGEPGVADRVARMALELAGGSKGAVS